MRSNTNIYRRSNYRKINRTKHKRMHKRMHKHKRSARKHNMRGGAFETIKDITGNPMELFNIKPGDHYKFFNFHMRFYDFDIEIINHRSSILHLLSNYLR